MSFPVFICGCMRSGTTLLMMLMDSGRGIALPPFESYFMANFYGAQARAGGGVALPAPADSLPWFARLAHGAYAPFCEPEEVRAAARRAGSYAGVFDAVNGEMARQVGKSRWADKTPGNEFFAADLMEMFPACRLIYVLRDPRDVIASKRDFARRHTSPREAREGESVQSAWLWRASMEAHLWNVAHLPRDRYLTVRYEELVTDTAEVMARVGEFVQDVMPTVTTGSGGRRYYRPICERTHYIHRGRANTTDVAGEPGAYEISTRSVGRWRGVLTLRERASAWWICRPPGGWRGTQAQAVATSHRTMGERELRYAGPLTKKGKFWFGQKGRRITDPLDSPGPAPEAGQEPR